MTHRPYTLFVVVTFAVAVLSFFAGVTVDRGYTNWVWQREAVKMHYAEWAVDKDGNVDWRWKQ